MKEPMTVRVSALAWRTFKPRGRRLIRDKEVPWWQKTNGHSMLDFYDHAHYLWLRYRNSPEDKELKTLVDWFSSLPGSHFLVKDIGDGSVLIIEATGNWLRDQELAARFEPGQ